MENFICTTCNYSLTIKKSSDGKTTPIVIKDLTNFLVEFYKKKNGEIVQLDIKFDENSLKKYLENSKNKIKDEDKNLILSFYYSNIRKNISKYNLVCSTCGQEYVLNPETIIYSLNFKNQHSTFNDDIDELVELKFNDPTLPRTKDYICPYSTCESNQKNFDTSKKEVVMYRANRSFHMKYACLVCKGPAWHI
jgi:hypothetical protein